MVMYKRLSKMLSVLAAILIALSVAGGLHASTASAAQEGVSPYEPSTIVIPFTKVWDDNDNELGRRPESITVKLYRYKGEGYTDADLYETATVTAEDGWKYDFVFNNDDDNNPAFYLDEAGKYQVYHFAVVEEPVSGYTETEHKDPAVQMKTLNEDENDWVWIQPNSTKTFPIYTESYPKSFIAAKKGNQLYIWTPEVISPIEQKILLALVREHPQFPHQDWEGTTYLTGFGYHSEGQFTMTAGNPGDITFDDHSSWSFWARGTYTRSTPEENACSITNKLETVNIAVTKVWNDTDDQDGIRPDSVTVNLLANGERADVDPLTLDEAGEWSGSFTGLPKYADGKEIEYTVEEDEVTGYRPAITGSAADGFTITNTHAPETISITVTKVWNDENDKDGELQGILQRSGTFRQCDRPFPCGCR